MPPPAITPAEVRRQVEAMVLAWWQRRGKRDWYIAQAEVQTRDRKAVRNADDAYQIVLIRATTLALAYWGQLGLTKAQREDVETEVWHDLIPRARGLVGLPAFPFFGGLRSLGQDLFAATDDRTGLMARLLEQHPTTPQVPPQKMAMTEKQVDAFQAEFRRAEGRDPQLTMDAKGNIVGGLDFAAFTQVFQLLNDLAANDYTKVAAVYTDAATPFAVKNALKSMALLSPLVGVAGWARFEAEGLPEQKKIDDLKDTVDSLAVRQQRFRQRMFASLHGRAPRGDELYILNQADISAELAAMYPDVAAAFRYMGLSVGGVRGARGVATSDAELREAVEAFIANPDIPATVKSEALGPFIRNGVLNFEALLDAYQEAALAAFDRASRSEAEFEALAQSSLVEAGEALANQALVPYRQLDITQWLVTDRPDTLQAALAELEFPTQEELATMPPSLAVLARLGFARRQADGSWMASEYLLAILRQAPGETVAAFQTRLNAILTQQQAKLPKGQPQPDVAEMTEMLTTAGALPLPGDVEQAQMMSAIEEEFARRSVRLPPAERQTFVTRAKLLTKQFYTLFRQLAGPFPLVAPEKQAGVLTSQRQQFGEWLRQLDITQPLPGIGVFQQGEKAPRRRVQTFWQMPFTSAGAPATTPTFGRR